MLKPEQFNGHPVVGQLYLAAVKAAKAKGESLATDEEEHFLAAVELGEMFQAAVRGIQATNKKFSQGSQAIAWVEFSAQSVASALACAPSLEARELTLKMISSIGMELAKASVGSLSAWEIAEATGSDDVSAMFGDGEEKRDA